MASEPIRKLALVFAMEAEALPCVTRFSLREIALHSPPAPLRVFGGTTGALELLVSVNGKDARFGVDRIGTEPAAQNALLTALRFQPDLMVSAGTAGGFKARGAEIGDVYLSEPPLRYHDHRIPLPGFEPYGEGRYPCIETTRLPSLLGVKLGRVSTANSLDATAVDLGLMDQFGAVVKEMEAAAVAQVAYDFSIPFLAVKSITDLVDSHEATHEVFLRNLERASHNLAEKLELLVEYLSAGRTFAEL